MPLEGDGSFTCKPVRVTPIEQVEIDPVGGLRAPSDRIGGVVSQQGASVATVATDVTLTFVAEACA